MRRWKKKRIGKSKIFTSLFFHFKAKIRFLFCVSGIYRNRLFINIEKRSKSFSLYFQETSTSTSEWYTCVEHTLDEKKKERKFILHWKSCVLLQTAYHKQENFFLVVDILYTIHGLKKKKKHATTKRLHKSKMQKKESQATI